MKINKCFANLAQSYLFVDIARKVDAYKTAHPEADIIRLGIGDVTRPLVPPVVDAMVKASEEMGRAETFRGYEDELGYPFLREAIAGYYAQKGVKLALDEIFVSDGAKSDTGNILDLFEQDNTVLIPDPVFPAYVDANMMSCRPIEYINANKENGFLPLPNPGQKADIIYICSPNNPTGASYTKAQLAQWVDYANSMGAVILYDAAYEAFVQTPGAPRSIYEVPGAETCAIEICSLSKTAGFTGTRCGYTIVPKALRPEGADLNAMWRRRQTTKYNGLPYVVQRAAQAVFSPAGMAACQENIAYYRQNAGVISAALTEAGVWHTGGVDSPYIWLECPGGLDSWAFFDRLLGEAGIVGTPGVGFGRNGEGYFRLTAFGDAARTAEAATRLKDFLKAL
ncbi:MAG: LL-diaminopimelate aminotransferase [Ruminococcaceae bacterium]|nr:LL-diaminopimelate aminotransferase [Oscillospiraceae bacterium]